MNAMERLRNSMFRVGHLVDFYQHSPLVILRGVDAAGRDVLDTTTDVTVEDLERLLDALADRDISIKRPKFKTQKEIENDIRVARGINEREEEITEKIKCFNEETRRLERSIGEHKGWMKGYEVGYKAGRDEEIAWREMQKSD